MYYKYINTTEQPIMTNMHNNNKTKAYPCWFEKRKVQQSREITDNELGCDTCFVTIHA